MNYPRYRSAQEAYRGSIQRIAALGHEVDPVIDPTSVASGFGRNARSTRELIAEGFVIEDPRARLVRTAARPINLASAIANVVWTLSGSNDLDHIGFYNPRGHSFSDDGRTLSGAVGHRIFCSEAGDQVEAVLERVRRDPASRRTVLQVLQPSDTVAPPRDTPCSIAFEFLLRNNELTAITFMRSQSAVGVLPYDLFLFTFLHETLAVALGAQLGAYYHICGSTHYYSDENETAQRVCESSDTNVHWVMPDLRVPMFGPGNPVAVAEADMRRRVIDNPAIDIDVARYELDDYWTHLLRVLLVAARSACGVAVSSVDLAALSPIYRTHLLP
jgi:thymidylate synthase